MKRFLLSLVISASALAIAPATHAATLEWQDISSVIPARKNRPVWDVAYAAPYVYFTDGVAFSKGGYIARTDGKWSKNLTADAKSSIARADYLLSTIPNQVTALESGYALRADKTFVIKSDWPQQVAQPSLTKEWRDGSCVLVNSLWTTPVKAGEGFCRWDSNFLSAWNGRSWYIVLDHKTLYRLDSTEVVKIGRVRDYFTSMTSDGRGHIYFGGTISTLEKNSPSSPLTAKLVKMTDVDAVIATENQPVPVAIDTSSGKTSTWTWTAPTITEIAQDGWTTFNVGAWNAKGISKIELMQDGTLLKNCSTSAITANCGSDVSVKNYAVGSSTTLLAKVTDISGSVTQTSSTVLKVTAATGAVILNPNLDIAISTELLPASDRIGRNGSIVMRATARAKNGLKRIVFHVNGSQRSACVFSNMIGVQTCDFQVNGWEYPYSQVSTFTAQAVDAHDYDAWAGVKSIRISDDATPPLSFNTTSWNSFSNGTSTIGAIDSDGVAQIEIFVNDTLRQSCQFQNGYGTRECAAAILNTDYVNGKALVNGKITDTFGSIAWTETKTLQK